MEYYGHFTGTASDKKYIPKPKGYLYVAFGELSAEIIGGPFAGAEGFPKALKVKLAKELDLPHDVNVPIPDFSTPSIDDANAALRQIIRAVYLNQQVYIGCMAGQGRTGLFLSLLAKVMLDYDTKYVPEAKDMADAQIHPVAYVRRDYYKGAVETAGQYKFVTDFDTAKLVRYARSLQPGYDFGKITAMLGEAADRLRARWAARRAG